MNGGPKLIKRKAELIMLNISKLEKTFHLDNNPLNDKLALVDINLTIREGDFISVIGGNGSGKTTLLNIIAGVHMPDRGNITLNNVELTKLKEYERARYIGRVFQDPLSGTVGDMSIEENLALASKRGQSLSLKWGLPALKRHGYKELLQDLDLGLETRLNAKVSHLSGGQRQALTLLMATMVTPDILLLDEHVAALDPKTARNVMKITEKIVTEKKITTLMITHNMKDAISYGNRLLMMSNGRIIFDCSDEEKKSLTVEQLISKFNDSSEEELPDSLVLSN